MADLKNPKLIVFKGVLFLILGVFASAYLIVLVPRIEVFVLLAISIWAFSRFYYFAFYVIENYVDSSYKFSGLFSAFQYLIQNRWQQRIDDENETKSLE